MVIILGFFSFFQWEFSLPVLAAVLAVLGYSVNESVVVFDRIRENFRKMRKATVPEVIDNAITSTMSRTIITHGCTQMMVTSMLIFGGETLHYFALALTIGILFGIYSSVLVASPLVMWLGVSREDLVKPEKKPTPRTARPSGAARPWRSSPTLWDLVLHLDQHLLELAQNYGAWVYAILFLIVFCETGLVVTPFLPGDSLLFVPGTLAAAGALDIACWCVLLIVAAIAGRSGQLRDRALPRAARLQSRRGAFSQPRIPRTHPRASSSGTAARPSSSRASCRSCAPTRRSWPAWARWSYGRFLVYNVAGGVLWVVSLTLRRLLLRQHPGGEEQPHGRDPRHHRPVDPAGYRRVCAPPARAGVTRRQMRRASSAALPM